MDVNNEAGFRARQRAICHRAISHRGRGAAGDSSSVAEAARSLAAWRRDRDQKPITRSAAAQGRAPNAPRRMRPAQELSPAQAGNDAGELLAPPGETESADPAADLPEAGRNCRPSSRRGLGRRKTRTSSRASLARRRSELRSASGHGRATSAAVSRRPPKRARPSRPNARRRNRQGSSTKAALPQLLQTLQQQQAGEFADIKTLADVERLAREDWPRYALWDVQQKKIAEVAQQLALAQQRQAQERVQQFSEFARREDDLFKEKVPDMADPRKVAELQTAALAVLKDLGFQETELAQSWQGRGICLCVTTACSS